MVAGNGLADPYTETNGANPDETESFPIEVPPGVMLVYWDVLGLLPSVRPPSAIFQPGHSTSTTCLVFAGGGASQPQGMSGYLQTTYTPTPNSNQGFEVRDFELAYEIDDHFNGIQILDVILDGVSAHDCQKAMSIKKNDLGSFNVLVKRSLFRGPDGSPFQPIAQIIEVYFDDALAAGLFSPSVEIRNCDLRPAGADLQSSAITILNRGGADDYLQVLIKNCHISGQPPVQSIPPVPVQKILGSCIEAVWETHARGRVTVQDCTLWDAEGDGVLGSVQTGHEGTAQGEIEILGCDVAFHGAPSLAISPAIAAATFSASGIHLTATEGGDWLDVEFRGTEARDNHRHGAFLELSSFDDESDAFRNVDVDYCNFSRNGLALGASEEGHGFYVLLKEATINLEMHRSLLARNHTTGFKAFLREGMTQRHQDLAITNTVISANEAKAAGDPGPTTWYLPRHISPFTVMSEDGDHTATINLSHVTFTDCEAPYAVSIYEWVDSTFGFNYQQLWSTASTVDNSVLKKNHFDYFGQLVDQAYYPEPPDPNNPPPGGHLWIRMFNSTSESNLGNQTPQFFTAYTLAQGNFYDEPSLQSFTLIGTDLGLVFPSFSSGSLSPLVDNGGAPVYASEATDVRGPGYPRVVDYGNNGSPIRDVGAFELQN